MPGTNHKMEANFLNNLSQNERPVVYKLLHDFYLQDMVEMRINGVTKELNADFNLSSRQWHNVINQVILTKVSYFVPDKKMSLEHIELLIKITAFALEKPSITLLQICHIFKDTHVFFYNWAKTLEEIRQEKIQGTSKNLSVIYGM